MTLQVKNAIREGTEKGEDWTKKIASLGEGKSGVKKERTWGRCAVGCC